MTFAAAPASAAETYTNSTPIRLRRDQCPPPPQRERRQDLDDPVTTGIPARAARRPRNRPGRSRAPDRNERPGALRVHGPGRELESRRPRGGASRLALRRTSLPRRTRRERARKRGRGRKLGSTRRGRRPTLRSPGSERAGALRRRLWRDDPRLERRRRLLERPVAASVAARALIVYALHDDHVGVLLDEALYHVEHVRLGLGESARPEAGCQRRHPLRAPPRPRTSSRARPPACTVPRPRDQAIADVTATSGQAAGPRLARRQALRFPAMTIPWMSFLSWASCCMKRRSSSSASIRSWSKPISLRAS